MVAASPAEEKYKSQTFSLHPSMVTDLREIAEERGWPLSIIGREAFAAWLRHYRATGQLTPTLLTDVAEPEPKVS